MFLLSIMRHAMPRVLSIKIGFYPIFFAEKSPFICIYQKKAVPLHPQRFLTSSLPDVKQKDIIKRRLLTLVLVLRKSGKFSSPETRLYNRRSRGYVLSVRALEGGRVSISGVGVIVYSWEKVYQSLVKENKRE